MGGCAVQIGAVHSELLLGIFGILPSRDVARKSLSRGEQLVDSEGGVYPRDSVSEYRRLALARRLDVGVSTARRFDRGAQRLRSAGSLEEHSIRPESLGFDLDRCQMLARGVALLLLLAQLAHAGVLALRGGESLLGPVNGVGAGLQVVPGAGGQPLEVDRLVGNEPSGLSCERFDVTLQALQVPGVALLFALGLAAAFVEPLLVVLVDLGAEQRSEHPLPVGVSGQQELRETVLGEQDHLQELLVGKADDLVDRVAHVARTRRITYPPLAAIRVRLQPLQQRVGGDDCHAGAAALGAFVVRRPRDAPPVTSGAELQRDLRRIVGAAVIAAQATIDAVIARDRAVEGEADRIEDAGLARSGATGDHEHPRRGQCVEVDILPFAERTEPLDLDPVDPHARASATARSASTSAMSAASASLAPSPSRTWARNASISSTWVWAVRTRPA